jgi:hypothetical protein
VNSAYATARPGLRDAPQGVLVVVAERLLLGVSALEQQIQAVGRVIVRGGREEELRRAGGGGADGGRQAAQARSLNACWA